MQQITTYTNLPPREGYRLTLEKNKEIAKAQEKLLDVNLSSGVKENKKLDIKA